MAGSERGSGEGRRGSGACPWGGGDVADFDFGAATVSIALAMRGWSPLLLWATPYGELVQYLRAFICYRSLYTGAPLISLGKYANIRVPVSQTAIYRFCLHNCLHLPVLLVPVSLIAIKQ